MTKVELLTKLVAIRKDQVEQCGEREDFDGDRHIEADALLLAYIDDAEITAAFDALQKHYA